MSESESAAQTFDGLMWQIHELKQQLADAEKRGAVKACVLLAENDLKHNGNRFAPVSLAATGLRSLIESGQVTL